MPFGLFNSNREPILAILRPPESDTSIAITDTTYETYRACVAFEVEPAKPSRETTYLTVDKYQPSLKTHHSRLRQSVYEKHCELVSNHEGPWSKESERSLLRELRDHLRQEVSSLDNSDLGFYTHAVLPKSTLRDRGSKKGVEIFRKAAREQEHWSAENDWLKELAGWKWVSVDGDETVQIAKYSAYLEAASKHIKSLDEALVGKRTATFTCSETPKTVGEGDPDIISAE